MESIEGAQVRSIICGTEQGENEVGPHQFGDQSMMSVPPETGSSFTALLKLPANQAVELLVHSPETENLPATKLPEIEPQRNFYPRCPPPPPIFPSDIALIDRASKFSVFAGNSLETSSIPLNSSWKPNFVKQEPLDSDSNPNSSPAVSNPTVNPNQKSTKRKDREKKVKQSGKKNKKSENNTSGDDKKSENNTSGDGDDKCPYVHVRARRGQATDSHSLAERARREKINARMKLLQELVPGCNKISGTALVLDEIINHVQYLQRQVEFLSMRLAAVNPRIDFNIDSLFAAEAGSPVENTFPGMIMPSMRPEGQANGNRQPYQQLWHFDGLHRPVWSREEDNPLLTYDSTNPASLHANQLKMEL